MKNTKKIVYILLGILASLIILFIGAFFLFQFKQEAPPPETESESYAELETEGVTETTESLENTEELMSTEIVESTEIIAPPVLTPLSYVDQIALDFVEKPQSRNREKALLKIKELARWYPALYFVYQNEAQYPIELILSGAGNPEMADFLYGFLSTDASVTGGFTDEEQPENYPLFLQFDTRWGYMTYGSGGNLGSSGCGPTCLAMAVFYLTGDRSCTPDAVAQYSLDNNHYVDRIGTAWTLLTAYPAEFGLSSFQIRWSEANLKAQLDKGRILICSVRPGDFTSSGHFIVIYGYDETGFKINDPKCVYRSRLTWTYEQIQDDIKATWSIGK